MSGSSDLVEAEVAVAFPDEKTPRPVPLTEEVLRVWPEVNGTGKQPAKETRSGRVRVRQLIRGDLTGTLVVMRKQYHFHRTDRGVLIWDVDRLVELTRDFESIDVPLTEIRELDETFWFDHEDLEPTCRRIALHAKLMNETDLSHPIILAQDGRVMDGMHRVCRALIEGRETVRAVRFDVDPEPDHVDVPPDELPY